MKKLIIIFTLLIIIFIQFNLSAQSEVELYTTEVCISNDGTANLVINGGTPAYTLIWRKYDIISHDINGNAQYGYVEFTTETSCQARPGLDLLTWKK